MSHTTVLPIVAGVLFAGGILAMTILFLQILRCARQSERDRRYRGAPWQSDVKRALVIALAMGTIGVANLTFWFNGQLRLYTAMTPGMPVGLVSVLRTEENLPRLILSTLDQEGQEAYEVFPVRDSNFRIYGERIRWSSHLAPLGLGDFFKVTRLEFLPPMGAIAMTAPTFHVDIRQGSTTLFDRLEGLDAWLPLLEVEALSTPIYDARGEFSGQMVIDSTGLAVR